MFVEKETKMTKLLYLQKNCGLKKEFNASTVKN